MSPPSLPVSVLPPDPHHGAADIAGNGSAHAVSPPGVAAASAAPSPATRAASSERFGPREQLLHVGPERLTEEELVALLLGTGSRRCSVDRLARDLLDSVGGLAGLARCLVPEIARVPGVGKAKASRVVAAIELGRRLGAEPWQPGVPFRDARQVHDHYAPRLRDERREFFIAAFLDVRHRLIGEEVISCGSLVASIVHPREVFRPAIRRAAAAVVCIHNHPSGDPSPSAEDWAVTERLRRSGETLGIELLDHVVIGGGAFTSLREACSAPRRSDGV